MTTNALKKILTTGVILMALAVGLYAQKASRGALKALPQPSAAQEADIALTLDTIAAPKAHTVDINGYDKPLRSRRETFFVTNNAPARIAALALTFTYFDQAGRQLHRLSRNLPADIPAGETRQISTPAWDVQQAFYYIRSVVPARTAQATPYDVTISVDTIFTYADQ